MTKYFLAVILGLQFRNYISLALVTPSVTMIISFGSRETRLVWEGRWVNSLPIEVQEIARRKLRMLHVSTTLQDLLIPPSNRLEKLQGDLKSYYSIRINRQWRLIFKWTGGHAEYVKIIDYH